MNNMAINFNSRGRIESLPKLTEGGEAALYEYKGSVLKIYKNGVNLSKKETKVKALIANRNKFPTNVIAPEDIVTVNGTFVGYSMKKLTAIEDFHMLTKPKFLNSQGLDNKDVLEIVLSLGKDLEALHKLGILVGDISDYNFQVSGKRVYFVDVDSWGVGKYSPDAYTELFTDPDAYQSGGCINFSHEGENYSFAVLAFNMLTRLHPFGGVYMKDKSLSILDRMKRKISVLGKHKADIKIPKVAGDWTWMSPELQEQFLKTETKMILLLNWKNSIHILVIVGLIESTIIPSTVSVLFAMQMPRSRLLLLLSRFLPVQVDRLLLLCLQEQIVFILSVRTST